MIRVVLFLSALLLAGIQSAQAQQRVLVFAAASMKNVLEAVGREFERDCGCKMVFSLAGSGALARQIEAGAPADVYISADLQWMDWLVEKNAIEVGTRRQIARNRLIVAVAKDRQLSDAQALEELLGEGRISMANPISVPAGRYGRQALKKLGLWEKLSGQLVFGENVRISLALAARRDVGAAIVYQSDLQVEPLVKRAFLFDDALHQPIVYPAALVRYNAMAERFLDFLTSPAAVKIFLKFGFSEVGDD